MTWPTSPAAVSGGTIPSAGINAIRADLAAINGYVLKTADQSVTSSTTLANDTHLFYTIGAAGTYAFDLYLYGTSAANAAGDMGIAFTFPTGTLYVGASGLDVALASGDNGTMKGQAGLSLASGTLMTVFGLSTTPTMAHVHGLLVATATGTLRLQWAQFASSASASTLKAGSHMLVKQVA
jgi:hypothetical protein